MTTIRGRSGGGDVAGIQGRSATTPAAGAAHLRIRHLRFGRLQLRLRRRHLRRGVVDLRLLCRRPAASANAPWRSPVALWPDAQLHAGVVYQLARQGAFLQQLLPAVQHLLGGIELLLVALHVGLRLHDGFRNGRQFGVLQVGLRLVHLAFVGGRRGHQVSVLQHRQKLVFLHLVAAVHQEPLHRSSDLRHHVPLIHREERAVRGHRAADGVLGHGGHLHRRGRFHFGFLFLGAAAGDDEARGAQQSRCVSSLAKTPP